MVIDKYEVEITNFLSDTSYDDLPDTAIQGVKRCILDTAGVMAAGAQAPGIGVLVGYLAEQNSARNTKVFGRGDQLSAFDSIWVNCAMTRANEFDDSHDGSGEHVSTPILGAGLGTMQYLGGVSGKEFIAAYAMAAELVPRLRSCPIRGSMPFVGFAANSYAPFSSAIMCARLMGLKGRDMYHALGWAYAQMAGAVQLQQGGSPALYIHHGLAGATGFRAAQLAQLGFPGTSDFLQGRFGVLNAYERGNYVIDKLVEGLGKNYVASEIGVKLYPSGRVTHTPIDAALALREKLGDFKVEEVDRIVVKYTKGGFAMTCLPEEHRHYPTVPQHARFSLYYCVASALLRGHVDLSDFSKEAVNDPAIHAVIEKMVIDVDENMPMLLPGIIDLTTKDGKTVSEHIKYMKGSAYDPVSWETIVNKARRCFEFGGVGSAEKVSKLAENIEHLEDFDNIIPVFFN